MKRMRTKNLSLLLIVIALVTGAADCSKNNSSGQGGGTGNPGNGEITYWVTQSDQTALLQKKPANLSFNGNAGSLSVIEVDSSAKYQSIDGFGYTLTGGSAYLINRLNTAAKNSLLQELFARNDNSIGISYLRISIGASDLNPEVFSYDDIPAGQTDVNLTSFSLSKDTVDVVPLLQQILAVNPSIKIMGSPWSAPVWMKDNGSSVGGNLQPRYYSVYAQYFVKYIQAMKAKGITIDAVTVQNEPQHGGNNPSMVMSAAQQADFIKNHLGPAFNAAGITTKIIIWDHNCDNPGYPVSILNDPAAKPFINGTAFHLYGGDISALSAVHSSHPDKALYFTEQWTGANAAFSGDFKWHIRNVIIGSMRNWSRVALEWNLASDGSYNPHTPGGCTECKGALTLDGAINRNVSYYIIGQVARFVPPGSVVIGSTLPDYDLPNVAFVTPEGKKVLLVLNDKNVPTSFAIKYKGKTAVANLSEGTAGTFIWQ